MNKYSALVYLKEEEQTVEWVFGDLIPEARKAWLEHPDHYVEFHGYKIYFNGLVLSKSGNPLAFSYRERRGGGSDICVRLHYSGKQNKWTLSRLVGTCFLGPVHGYEMNHKDRNPHNNHICNLERVTPSENQTHWRRASSSKDKDIF